MGVSEQMSEAEMAEPKKAKLRVLKDVQAITEAAVARGFRLQDEGTGACTATLSNISHRERAGLSHAFL